MRKLLLIVTLVLVSCGNSGNDKSSGDKLWFPDSGHYTLVRYTMQGEQDSISTPEFFVPYTGDCLL